MQLSIVIPAYNEEKYLPDTLDAITRSLANIPNVELIVVNNQSTDSTRDIALEHGATVVDETEHNIGRVRNTGAAAANGEVLVFIDADTIVFPGVFENILEMMSDERCFGGGVAVDYQKPYRRFWFAMFVKTFTFFGALMKMRGGACVFCRRDIFQAIGGFDETIYVGEDIDFNWRLDKLALTRGGYTALVESPRVSTSSRRFNQMGTARILFFTHPVTVLLGWRIRSLWKDWYENLIR